jgi:putative transposase
MTLYELDRWLALYVAGQYHNAVHQTLGRPPLAVWNELVAKHPLRHPEDADEFHVNFLPFEERQIRRDGIALFNIQYWDDILSVWAGRSTKKHRVRYDPRNMARVFLEAPDGKCWPIRTRNLLHPEVTLWEAKSARRALLAQGRCEVDEQLLFAAIEARRFVIEEASAKTKAMRARRQRTVDALRGVHTLSLPRPLKQIEAPTPEEPLEGAIQPYEMEDWS